MNENIDPTEAQNRIDRKDFRSVFEFADLLKKRSRTYGTNIRIDTEMFAEAFSNLVLDEEMPLSEKLKDVVSDIGHHISIEIPFDGAATESEHAKIANKKAREAATIVNQHMVWERLGDVQNEVEYP